MTQGYGIELVSAESLVLGKLDEASHGVCPGGQHEYQRHEAVGVGIGTSKVKGRRLYKLIPELQLDKLDDERNNLVRPQASQDYHLLEVTELLVPGLRESCLVRLTIIVIVLPFIQIPLEASLQLLKGLELCQATYFIPGLV